MTPEQIKREEEQVARIERELSKMHNLYNFGYRF